MIALARSLHGVRILVLRVDLFSGGRSPVLVLTAVTEGRVKIAWIDRLKDLAHSIDPQISLVRVRA